MVCTLGGCAWWLWVSNGDVETMMVMMLGQCQWRWWWCCCFRFCCCRFVVVGKWWWWWRMWPLKIWRVAVLFICASAVGGNAWRRLIGKCLVAVLDGCNDSVVGDDESPFLNRWCLNSTSGWIFYHYPATATWRLLGRFSRRRFLEGGCLAIAWRLCASDYLTVLRDFVTKMHCITFGSIIFQKVL